jgi:hypothetical protein
MILASHGLIASQIASFDADAVAFFDRVTAAGGTLSATEKIATNQLVIDLKANSLWTPMKAIYPMVGASAAACAQNLKSSSFTGTFTSTGWTFASTGAKGNGTSAFMNTGLNVISNLSQNNSHISYYSRTDVSGLVASMGAGIGNDNAAIMLMNLAGGAYVNLFGSTLASPIAVATNSLRMRILTRTNSSNLNYFTNTTKSTENKTSVVGANFNIYLNADNNQNSARWFSSQECAFSSIGDGLTDTQASNFYTAVQAFQTTLSRQV